MNGELHEFNLDISSIFSREKYEKECRNVLRCVPTNGNAIEKCYVERANEIGYTHDIHIYRNIKIQFIKSLQKFTTEMKVLLQQCYVCFLSPDNHCYELYKDNQVIDTTFADLILSKKIDNHSVLYITILPISQIESIAMHDVMIYLAMNKHLNDINDNAIIWITRVGNSLIASTYVKNDKSLKFITYNHKEDIPIENCIDIAKQRLEKY